MEIRCTTLTFSENNENVFCYEKFVDQTTGKIWHTFRRGEIKNFVLLFLENVKLDTNVGCLLQRSTLAPVLRI